MELPYQLQEIIPYFEELHEKVFKKNRDSGCTTRAQLLYLVLENKGMDPKILRYFVKGEEEKDESGEKKQQAEKKPKQSKKKTSKKLKKTTRCPKCQTKITCEGTLGEKTHVTCPNCGNKGIITFEKPT